MSILLATEWVESIVTGNTRTNMSASSSFHAFMLTSTDEAFFWYHSPIRGNTVDATAEAIAFDLSTWARLKRNCLFRFEISA